MKIDCHVHLVCSAATQGAYVSPRMRRKPAFWFIERMFALHKIEDPVQKDAAYVEQLVDFVETSELDRAVLLGFDRVYGSDGRVDEAHTHVYVPNDLVFDVCAKYPEHFLAGASVHPLREDALDELERVKQRGAVLVKLLPNSHRFDPGDARLDPYWKKLADLKLGLLIHAGFEHTIPTGDQALGRPERLRRALDSGVTLIVAHAGTAGMFHLTETMGAFWKLIEQYPNCYGDTSALTNFWRAKYLNFILDPNRLERAFGVRIAEPESQLVHGSDFPIPITPFAFRTKLTKTEREQIRSLSSPLQKDIAIKRSLGLSDAPLYRAAQILDLN